MSAEFQPDNLYLKTSKKLGENRDIFSEEEYHSMATRVHEISQRMRLSTEPLSDDDKKTLISIRSQIPSMIQKEKEWFESKKMQEPSTPVGDSEDGSAAVVDTFATGFNTELDRHLRERVEKHNQFAKYLETIISADDRRKNPVQPNKDETKIEPTREQFNGADYRDSQLAALVPEYGDLRAIVEGFSNTKIELKQFYKDSIAKMSQVKKEADVSGNINKVSDAKNSLITLKSEVLAQENGSAKAAAIDLILNWLTSVEASLRDYLSELQGQQIETTFDQWKSNVEIKYFKDELDKATAIGRKNRNSITDFKRDHDELELIYNAANSKAASKLKFAPADKQAEAITEIRNRVLDRIRKIQTDTVDSKAYAFWEKTYIPTTAHFNELAGARLELKSLPTDFKSVKKTYDRLLLARSEIELQRQSDIDTLPTPDLQAKAAAYLATKIARIDSEISSLAGTELFAVWESDYLPNTAHHKALLAAQAEMKTVPADYAGAKSVYDRAVVAYDGCVAQRDRDTDTLPLNKDNRVKAGQRIDTITATAKADIATYLTDTVYAKWESEVKISNPLVAGLEAQITAGAIPKPTIKDVVGGDIGIETQQSNLRAEIAKFSDTQIDAIVVTLPKDLRDKAAKYLKSRVEYAQKLVDDVLEKAKQSLLLVLVSKVSDTTNKILNTTFDINQAEAVGFDALKNLRDDLEKDLYLATSSGATLESLPYEKAQEKILKFIDEIEFKTISFKTLADEILNEKSLDLSNFMNSGKVENISPRHKKLLDTLKIFWIQGPPPKPDGTPRVLADGRIDVADPEVIEYYHQKMRVFLHLEAAIETDKSEVAGDASQIFERMQELQVTRDMLTIGITNHPVHGQKVREMIDYLITQAGKPDAGNPIGYGVITNMPAHEAVGFVKSHVKEKYLIPENGVPTGDRTLPPEFFKAAFDAWFAYDLLSDSLALRESRTETRNHNKTVYDTDPNSITRPLHYMLHSGGKGGVLTGNFHLLAFAKNLPPDMTQPGYSDTGWLGVNDKIEHGHVTKHGLATMQEGIKLRMEAAFPLGEGGYHRNAAGVVDVRGISDAIEFDPGDPDSWNAPWFPTNRDFLFEPDLKKIPAAPLAYTDARTAFGKIIYDYILAEDAGLGLPADKDITEHDVTNFFSSNGAWTKFATEIGKVIPVKGMHHDLLQPFLLYWMGRVGTFCDYETGTRHELTIKWADALQGTRYLDGKAKGFDEVRDYLLERTNTDTYWGEPRTFAPPLLRPALTADKVTGNYEKRKAYLDFWITHDQHKPIPASYNVVTQDKDVRTYWRALGTRVPPRGPEIELPEMIKRSTTVKKEK